MKTRLITSFLIGFLSPFAFGAQTSKPSEGSGLGFSPGASNEFTFDTGVLRGLLRAGGRSMGLSSVIHEATGLRLDSSLGLFSPYRIFTSGKRYGTAAWDWVSEAAPRPDGSVEVRWPATGDHPFELQAHYRWATPNALDLQITVRGTTDLPKFEVFLASYFVPSFTNSRVFARNFPDGSAGPAFVSAERKLGTRLIFPRDDSVISIIRDGRWKFEPNPVDWRLMPTLAKPLGVRNSPATSLTAFLMSPPTDCFAIATPDETDAHYSMYLSLFGHDLKPGETAHARARLVLGSHLSDAEIVKAYETYLPK